MKPSVTVRVWQRDSVTGDSVTVTCLPFVCRALQIELKMHLDARGQQVVHDYQSDVLLVCLRGKDC